ncbi:hypothetical protein LI094_13950, partial [[Clostridium] saccharogumia]|uniref:hypothetical protein n=1 Tax=Thomasclavelia saccharogumia TaxID=341225 RepID=UPI001D07A20F
LIALGILHSSRTLIIMAIGLRHMLCERHQGHESKTPLDVFNADEYSTGLAQRLDGRLGDWGDHSLPTQ